MKTKALLDMWKLDEIFSATVVQAGFPNETPIDMGCGRQRSHTFIPALPFAVRRSKWVRSNSINCA
jgi:hypothetical protein